MCCSESCLKGFLSFFTFITLGVGVAGIVFGIIQLVDYGGHLDFSGFNPQTASTILLLVAGLLALIVGIFGLVGARKKNRCCLCLYQFGVFPLVLVSLAVAGLATYANIMTGNMDDLQGELSNCEFTAPYCNGCGTNKQGEQIDMLQWVTDFNYYAQQVTVNVYGTDSCQILITEGQQETFDEINKEYGLSLKTTTDALVGKSNALDCDTLTDDQKSAGGFLYYFEQTYECSGMCAYTPYYVFNDSKIPEAPNGSCYSKIVDFMGNVLVLIISWAIFLYFLLNVILSCCLCCHPDRKDNSQDMYARLNYYD